VSGKVINWRHNSLRGDQLLQLRNPLFGIAKLLAIVMHTSRDYIQGLSPIVDIHNLNSFWRIAGKLLVAEKVML
jgi:hypothetical protein